MIGQLRHRGPDDSGYFLDERVGLAHSRLSILDLEGGKQPLANPDESVWVVFNGEIFNFVELRAELESQGHVFRTRSDTEVIVHLYDRFGDDFVSHLNGQFAIGLWDRRRRRLVLARDRVGIRPLFYTVAGSTLYFASEIKALLALPRVVRRLDPRALGQVLTFWSALAPATLFEGIALLPPGHLLVWEADTGTRHQQRYWDWEFPEAADEPERPLEAYAEELRELLTDAVRIQLRSDVPVGAYLSGGLDSAIVAALIKNCAPGRLRTFSLGFEDGEFDESSFQDEMVRFLGTDHTRVHCSRKAICQEFPRAVWHAETAIVRTAPAPMMLLSREVRAAGYKVVLTGEGADEVFGGYDLFKEARVRRFWARNPESRIRPLILGRLYPYLEKSPTASPHFARQFFGEGLDDPDVPYFGHLTRWSTTRRAWRFFSRDMRAALAGWDPIAELAASLPPEISRWKPLCRDQYVEAHTLLSGYLLAAQGDRPAMANSVEARHPFLDHRVIAFANRLPVRYKLMGLQEKFLLRRALAPLLPPGIWRRPKQPYRAPDSSSFFRDGKPAPYVAELFSPSRLRSSGYFDVEATSRLFEKCRRGLAIGFADNMAFVGILSTMLLDEMFCGAMPRAIGA